MGRSPATAPPRTVERPGSRVEPLTAELCRVHLTVPRRLIEKLERAKDALSHSHAGADDAAVLEEALDVLLERAAKRKGLVKRPRGHLAEGAMTFGHGRGGTGGDAVLRYVPAAVRREVWARDEGRCQWPTSHGGICGSTHRLQLDHVVPVGRGGRSTAENLRLCCAFHNDLAAREVYGDAWMDRFTGRPARLDSTRVGPTGR